MDALADYSVGFAWTEAVVVNLLVDAQSSLRIVRLTPESLEFSACSWVAAISYPVVCAIAELMRKSERT